MPILILFILFTSVNVHSKIVNNQDVEKPDNVSMILPLSKNLVLRLNPVEEKNYQLTDITTDTEKQSFIKYQVIQIKNTTQMETLGYFHDVYSSRIPQKKLSAKELVGQIQVIGNIVLFPAEEWTGSPGSETRTIFNISKNPKHSARNATIDMSNYASFIQIDKNGSFVYETDDGDIRASIAYFDVSSWTNAPDIVEPLDLGHYKLLKKINATTVLVRKILSVDNNTRIQEQRIEIDLTKIQSKAISTSKKNKPSTPYYPEASTLKQQAMVSLESLNNGLNFTNSKIDVPTGFTDIRQFSKKEKNVPIIFLGTSNSRDERAADGDASTNIVFAVKKAGYYNLQIGYDWIEQSIRTEQTIHTTKTYSLDIYCKESPDTIEQYVLWDPLTHTTDVVTMYQNQLLLIPLCLGISSRISTQSAGQIGIRVKSN